MEEKDSYWTYAHVKKKAYQLITKLHQGSLGTPGVIFLLETHGIFRGFIGFFAVGRFGWDAASKNGSVLNDAVFP